MKVAVESVESRGRDLLITVRFYPSWLGKMLGRKPTSAAYRGSCTVWRSVSTGERAGSWLESYLATRWKKWQWDQGDARATAPSTTATSERVAQISRDSGPRYVFDRIQLEPSEAPTLDTSPEPLDFGIDNIASTPAGQCGADHCFAKAVGGLDLCAVHTDVLLAMDLGGDS